MLLLILILVLTIPLASLYLSTILSRNAFLIFLSGVLLSGILGGLFQPTLFSQSLDVFIQVLGNLSFMEQSNSLLSLIPIIVYSNADTAKSSILSDNKGKSGIYMWTHIESGKIYIGSAIDLSKRFLQYYSKSYLKRNKL
jgi:hypothetical protein